MHPDRSVREISFGKRDVWGIVVILLFYVWYSNSMTLFKNTYLSVLKRENKSLFYGVLIFLVCMILSSIPGFEFTPFYSWTMYSYPLKSADTNWVYEIQYNDGKQVFKPQLWQHYNRNMIDNSIVYYYRCRKNNSEDPSAKQVKRNLIRLRLSDSVSYHKMCANHQALDSYPRWLHTYLASYLNENIDSLKVFRVGYLFENAKIAEVSRKMILKD